MQTYILTVSLGTFILNTAFDSLFLAERAGRRALSNGADSVSVAPKPRRSGLAY
jgi:hypothetical protein